MVETFNMAKLTTTQKHEIYETVHNYPSKHGEGLTPKEERSILKNYPEVDTYEYFKKMGIHTVLEKGGEILTLHNDIYNTIIQCLEKRDSDLHELD